MTIRAIFFDFGGVLIRMVDDRPRHELAKQLGVPSSRLDDLVFNSETAHKALLGQIPVSIHWEAVRQALGIAPGGMPGFLEKYWSADDLNWELLEYIRTLRPAYQVGLLSNAWDDLRQTLHERWNIDGLFNAMIISAEEKMAKPDPRIFQLAVDRMLVPPENAIFIDDVVENVASARAIGLVAIQYHDLRQVITEVQSIISTS